MSVINILAKMPSEIKERIEIPSRLVINNDEPGLYIPNEYIEHLKQLLDMSKDSVGKKNDDVSTNHIKLINAINNALND